MPKNNGKNRRIERRKSAMARMDNYRKLTTRQKLDKLPKEGANRQRTRLLEQLKVEQKVAAEKKNSKRN